MPASRPALRVGDGEGNRLDFCNRSGRIAPARLDDREGAGLAEYINQIGRRGFGDDDHWTQQCHNEEPFAQNRAILRSGC